MSSASLRISTSLFLAALLGGATELCAQQSVVILRLDSILENAVLRQDGTALDSLYASDFEFSHGTGEHDTKPTWLHFALGRPAPFRNRLVDSVVAESHPSLAITAGRLWVESRANERYGWRFVRVWRLEGKRWQLVSHRSIAPLSARAWP